MPDPQSFESIDLNVLPEQYRPRVASPVMMLVWGAAILFAVLWVPTFLLNTRAKGQLKEINGSLAQAKQTLQVVRTPPADMIGLTQQYTETMAALESFRAIQTEISAVHRDWPAMFRAILDYDPNRVRLSSVFQDNDYLTLTGIAASQDDALVYANALSRSQMFEQINVQSMESSDEPFAPPVPTAVGPVSPPAITPTSGGGVTVPTAVPTAWPTAAPTQPQYDTYEPDDASPQTIAIDEAHWHNFYPVNDADMVKFLGRAGRRYCIQAVPQSAIANPYMQVLVGDQTYSNDNCSDAEASTYACHCPRDSEAAHLASMVGIEIASTGDQEVLIKVTNLGDYAPNAYYSILVYESTGDAWEKDDLMPASITVGETQERTFHPVGDIDRVTFAVKEGHAYVVETDRLAAGVDTIVTVLIDGVIYQNNDFTPGEGASRVEFHADSDSKASVTITNKGQFGIGSSYELTLGEVGGDAYEPDDNTPHLLSVGEHQRHTFYPEGDVDQVEFHVKAGRLYEISTYSLTVGVDTVVSVSFDGATYENDDRYAGDHGSYIMLSAVIDGIASATVTNREQYGVGKSYWLTLRELAGTPTPDMTRLPVMTSTPAPTPTSDCGDFYEPDDIVGQIIGVGEEQLHDFCPVGDQDRCVFTAKAGHTYRVETYNLGIGVDTQLAVQIGSNKLTNDDRTAQDKSSVVEIQNQIGSDGPGFITVTNKGQHGEGKTYYLKVTTLSKGDDYEGDDINPRSILIGVPETHSFFPAGDLDKVYFIARAGRKYSVQTTSLTAGVDTVLTAQIGAQVLSHDNRTETDLSSYLEVGNEDTRDLQVVVTVANNGQFAPDKTYAIRVDDIGIVGGDAYEPDLETQQRIALDQVQQHTFYPSGDIDQVIMHVDAGHRYAVMTCGSATLPGDTGASTVPFDPVALSCEALPGGVDSLIVLHAGATSDCEPSTCECEDALPGTAYANSRIEFTAAATGDVTIRIYNNGVFSPEATYYLRAHELSAVPPTPAGTATPTPTPTITPTTGPSATPTTTPTRTPMPGPYPGPASQGRTQRYGLAAPLLSRSAGGILPGATMPAEQTTGRAVRFVLLLQMKKAMP